MTLPLSLALDSANAQALCEKADADAGHCPATSIVGHTKAVSILHVPLEGPVYFVKGVRTDLKTGRQVRTLPTLWIPLSGEGVRIDVHAASSVPDGRHLVTTFDGLPDAPISSFDLRVDGGRHGILAGRCRAGQHAVALFAGHNGKVLTRRVAVSTRC